MSCYNYPAHSATATARRYCVRKCPGGKKADRPTPGRSYQGKTTTACSQESRGRPADFSLSFSPMMQLVLMQELLQYPHPEDEKTALEAEKTSPLSPLATSPTSTQTKLGFKSLFWIFKILLLSK